MCWVWQTLTGLRYKQSHHLRELSYNVVTKSSHRSPAGILMCIELESYIILRHNQIHWYLFRGQSRYIHETESNNKIDVCVWENLSRINLLSAEYDHDSLCKQLGTRPDVCLGSRLFSNIIFRFSLNFEKKTDNNSTWSRHFGRQYISQHAKG